MKIDISFPRFNIEELSKVRKNKPNLKEESSSNLQQQETFQAIEFLRKITELQLRLYDEDYALTKEIEKDIIKETLETELKEIEEWLHKF